MKQESELGGYGIQSYIAVFALSAIFFYLILHFFVPSLQSYERFPLYLTLIVGGIPLIYDLIVKALNRDFGSDLLAGISIITSVFLDEYLAGSLVVLMLSGGQSLENYAIRTASKVLDALARRAPTIAHRIKGDEFEEIPVAQIAVGDALQIFPHEICPVDGEVIAGNSVMDESYLTGEPFMLSKAPGSFVISGSINGDGSLQIKATKEAQDSQYAKIMQVMKESEQKRPRIRRLADQLGAWYTPFAVIMALSAWGFSGEAVRFLAVLVIATPCPLLIAIPVAIIGSISLCARQGILIKNPVVLEQIDQCRTMIFDKTGTLTYGKPTLTAQTVFDKIDSREVLKLVASLERYSRHPLAAAILEQAEVENLDLVEAKQVSEKKGEGLKGIVDGKEVTITSRKLLARAGQPIRKLPEGEGLECLVEIDGQLSAHYRFRDAPRMESKSFIQHLFTQHRLNKVMIVSGDREEEVRYLANCVGISEVHASKSPQEKVDIVVEEVKKAKTAYLGDGINDAPALIAATVGMALGRNSDITSEAAGAVILESSLEKVDEFLHISKRMRKIALQSAAGGIFLSIIGMTIAAFGYLPPVAGAISQEIIDVVVILNALRTIWPPAKLTDIP
jgi:heavy metal translocating P-type ATPase